MTAPSAKELPVPAGHCPVCGGALADGRLVSCARCDAVHHRDCIEYGGGCAIFACGSRAYRAARGNLVHVLRPPPEPCQLDKIGFSKDDGALVTLERPVLRVDARNVTRARRRAAAYGAVLAALGLCATVWVSLELLVQLLQLAIALAITHALMLMFLLPFTLFVIWTMAATLVPGAAYALGYLLHSLDGGEFVLEPHRLVRRFRPLGLPAGERSWSTRELVAIALTAGGREDTVRLEARLTAGRVLVLADDSRVFMDGYHWTDLARIGRRMAADAGVPFECNLPWKTTE